MKIFFRGPVSNNGLKSLNQGTYKKAKEDEIYTEKLRPGVYLELDYMGFKGEVGPSSEERMPLKRREKL